MGLPRIVCGVDRSADARHAAAFAAELARRLRVRLVLVHALPGAGRRGWRERGETGAAERQEAAALLRRVGRELEGVEERTSVEFGKVHERLIAVAGDGLIVVGCRGEGAIRATLLGSVSSALAGQAPTPIAVVPPKALDRTNAALAGRSVVCGVRDARDAQAARLAARLATALGLELTLAHVMSPMVGGLPVSHADVSPPIDLPSDEQAAFSLLHGAAAEAAEEVAGGATLRVVEGTPGAGLAQIASDEEAAVITVGKPEHGALGGTVLGSASRHLMRRGTRPVIVCPPAWRLSGDGTHVAQRSPDRHERSS